MAEEGYPRNLTKSETNFGTAGLHGANRLECYLCQDLCHVLREYELSCGEKMCPLSQIALPRDTGQVFSTMGVRTLRGLTCPCRFYAHNNPR
jgi:hypothetical protein